MNILQTRCCQTTVKQRQKDSWRKTNRANVTAPPTVCGGWTQRHQRNTAKEQLFLPHHNTSKATNSNKEFGFAFTLPPPLPQWAVWLLPPFCSGELGEVASQHKSYKNKCLKIQLPLYLTWFASCAFRRSGDGPGHGGTISSTVFIAISLQEPS